MAAAPRVLDQAYVPQSSAEKGEPAPKLPILSPRSVSPGSTSPTAKAESPKPFSQMSSREQVRWLWGSRRRKTRKPTRKNRRKTLKRRTK